MYQYRPNMLKKMEKLHVIGDIHGDLNSLQMLLKEIDLKQDGAIFLGDYADRGPSGVEVIDQVASLIHKFPDNVVALKGNHESYKNLEPCFNPCDLIDEVEMKRHGWPHYFDHTFEPFVGELYISAIIPGEILFVHGGISKEIESINDLRHMYSSTIKENILWSDPCREEGQYDNPRGAGVLFGPDVTKKVCERLDVKKIIRSHEPRKAEYGPCHEHDGAVITTSATSVYGGRAFALEIDLNDMSIL